MSLEKKNQLGSMAKKKKKPTAQRSRRSGIKTAELIKKNNEIIENIWTCLNINQALKNL